MTEDLTLDDDQINYLVDTFIKPVIVDAIKQQTLMVMSWEDLRQSLMKYLEELNGHKVFSC
jgi:hypothetical protein